MRSRRRGARSWSTCLAVALVLGCSLDRTAQRPPDVLLLVVDTLRADHLGVYGYSRGTSPALDAFARDAIVFEQAVSPAPWTLPAVASILTSTYPSVHGLRSRGTRSARPRMRKGLTTLAEAFSDAGYRTVAVGTNPWINTKGHGLQQGFEVYATPVRTGANWVNALARKAMESDDQRPLFLYLHYMDVHGPYGGSPIVKVPKLCPIDPRYDRELAASDPRAPGYLEVTGAKGLGTYVNAYDRGIQTWDLSFGRLVDWLRDNGRLDTSVIAVTSDHGEELLDHGGWNHGFTVYEEQIRVPWILRAPGRAGERVSAATSLVDLAPTLLGLAAVPAPDSMTGLNALAAGASPDERPILSETHIRGGNVVARGRPLLAVRRGDMKWIVGRDQRRCFDLAADPRERSQARCDGRDFADAESWIGRLEDQGAELGRVGRFEAPPEQLEQLRKLGYLE